MFYSIYYLLFFLYEEVLYKLVNGAVFHLSFIVSIFYLFFIALILGTIAKYLPRKINNILFPINILLLSIYYGTCIIVKKTFGITINVDAFKMYKQFTTGGFENETLKVLGQSILLILLILIPFIISLVFIRLYKPKHKNNIQKVLINIVSIILAFALFICGCFIDTKDSLYSLYFDKNNNTLNVEHFGVLPSIFMDLRKTLTGFKEVMEIEELEEIIEEKVYEKNIIDIDFDLIESNNNDIINTTNYIKSDQGTYKNDYTGLYEGKNLIYIMAESFDSYFVSEDLTPTLYKLINEGLHFSNFYSPTNLSTIGGEFSLLTGLLPDLTELNSSWQSDNPNYYPYGLASLFKDLGYSTYAYHDHTYSFQGRDKYLKAIGFDNYKGCWNGLEKSIACNLFPESDKEMVNATYSDYINDEHFLVYYATVSGHGSWDFIDNDLAIANKDLVENIEGSDTYKAYVAANLELERALSDLLQILEDNGRLEDTVIILSTDHHPYFMSDEEMEELAKKELDQFSIYKNDLIIYNSLDENITIDKYCNTIDVLPTTLNLFGINYDSRLIIGKDILSNEEGIVIFADNSWITDKGRYSSTTNTFYPANSFDEDEESYVTKINNRVANKYTVSRNIMKYNYYNLISKKS